MTCSSVGLTKYLIVEMEGTREVHGKGTKGWHGKDIYMFLQLSVGVWTRLTHELSAGGVCSTYCHF